MTRKAETLDVIDALRAATARWPIVGPYTHLAADLPR